MIPIDSYFQRVESAKKRSGGTWRIQSMCQSQWKWVNNTVFTCFYPLGNNNFLHNIGDICGIIDASIYYLDTETRPQVSKGWILHTPKRGFTHFMALGSAHSCLWCDNKSGMRESNLASWTPKNTGHGLQLWLFKSKSWFSIVTLLIKR
jgi:hypothetical protein